MKYQAEFETTLVTLPDYKLDGYCAVIASLIRKAMDLKKENKQNELLDGCNDCGADRVAGGDVGTLAALESAATETETGQDCELSDGSAGVSDSPDGAVFDDDDD
jgi:hypothetical protein